MRSLYRVLGFLLSFWVCVAARAGGEVHAAALDKDNSPWWAHIKTLASDDYQGRLTGSPAIARRRTTWRACSSRKV